MSKKVKKKRQFKDQSYSGIQLTPADYIQHINFEFSVHRHWKLSLITTKLTTSMLSKLFKRQIILKQKIAALDKTIPDYLLETAASEFIQELKDIRKILRTTTKRVYKIKHIKSNNSWFYHLSDGYDLQSAWRQAITALRMERSNKLKPCVHAAVVGDTNFAFHKYGLVHCKPKEIYNFYLKRRSRQVYMEKKPMNDDKYVGIELEFCAAISQESLGLELLNAGLGSLVHLKTDGSLRPKPGETAFEIAFLVPEKEYRLPLKKLCDVLTRVGAQTEGRRCGLHVHFDMRKRNKELIYNNLVSCQNVLWELIPPNRRDNEFCKHVASRAFPKKFNGSREERYRAINAAAYYRHKTLEVRMHEGTVDFSEIRNWLMVLTKIVNYRRKLPNKITSIRGFKKKFKVTGALLTYLQDRANFWALNEALGSENPMPQQPSVWRQVLDEAMDAATPVQNTETSYTITNSVTDGVDFYVQSSNSPRN